MPAMRGTFAPTDRDLRAVGVAKAGDRRAVDVGRGAGEDEALHLARGMEAVEVLGGEAEPDAARWIVGQAGWSASVVSPVSNSLQKADWNLSGRPRASR